MSAVVEVKNLTKEYKQKKAVDDLSFEIRQGEILGLLGPNGSGKSTTINCILSLLKYSAGSIKIFGEEMTPDAEMDLSGKPAVILVIGVNGVGKTTSIAKLADYYTRQGKRVMLAAGDTFRAAASEQLEIWASRAGVPIVSAGEGADPAAVIFDTVKSATARGYDMVIADTAGRLHNKSNLMAELSKISRSVKKASPEASLETLLVLDAITGQNAISQAREFCKAANATGIILTKLDGTAKGGCVVAVKQRLGLPVRFIGVGEGIDDLIPFTPEGYVEELLPRQWKH